MDINLDKTTILLPAKKGYEPHNSRIHWGLHEDRGQIAEKSERGYSDLLTDLLPRFPMVGKRKAANLPYRLCSTLEELSELVMGRRKVIEVGELSRPVIKLSNNPASSILVGARQSIVQCL